MSSKIESKSSNNTNKKIEPWVFFPPLVFIILFCIWVFRDPQKAGDSLQSAFNFITNQMAWVYEWYIFAIFIICLFFAFGPYANKRLGDEKPEFSTLSWLGMIFTGVIGVGVLTWASFEFFYYLQTPPFGIEPFSPAAHPWALSYPLFHWGFTIYALYTVFGLVFAYMFFVKKKDVVRPSTACEPIFGQKLVKGWLGKLIDVLFVIGFTGGVVTCIGVNVPTVVGLVSKVFHTDVSLSGQSIIILSWSVFMALLLYTGLKKGVRFLSDFRVYFGFALLAFILFFGPTTYILNTFTDSVGHLLQNFVRMSLNTDAAFKSGVPQAWTIFYWAWYMALTLQSAIFLGRISRGRTVREFTLGALLAQTLGCWLFWGVFQNFSMYVYEKGTVPIAQILADKGQGAAIVEIWTQLPLSGVMMVVLLVYAYIAMQTLLNASVYTLAMVTTRELSGQEEPPKWNRIFWSIALGIVAIALAYIGGIRPAQTTTVIGSLPMLIVATLVLAAFFKDIRQTWSSKHPSQNTSPSLNPNNVGE
jgi:L-carnitine/gamma-butyrobetaine antiporter